MNHPRHRLVFFGTDAFSLPSLVRLLAEGWDVAAIVTKPDSRVGRGHGLSMPPVKKIGISKKIPVLQPRHLKSITAQLAETGATAGVVVAYGKLIPPELLSIFDHGLINVHASLLPKYRGASPIEAAILAGDELTGVTLMRIDEGMDTGPTFEVAHQQLTGEETRLDLYERLAEQGAELLVAKLAAILDGNIVPIPQDNTNASHAGLTKKADGIIDWAKPAVQLEREIRGYLGWPGSHTTIAGTDVIITAARIISASGPIGEAVRTSSGELVVYAGEEGLIIDSLKPAGKREMSGPEFLAGHRIGPTRD